MIASEYDELDRELGDLGDERGAKRRGGGMRVLPVMVGVVSLLALGGIIWYAYTQGVREGSEVAAPLLRPEAPAKETPDDPGGRQIAGADLGVYDIVNGNNGGGQQNVERILPEPEEPQTPPAPPPTSPPPQSSSGQGADTTAAARAPVPAPEPAPLPDQTLAAPDAPPPTAGSQTQEAAAAPVEAAPAAEIAPPPPPAEEQQSAAAPTTEPAAPAGSAGQGWRIQIAALKSDAAARSQWTKIQNANSELLGALALEVQQAKVNGTDYFRVRGGPLANADAAKALCVKLKAKGVACIPVAPGK